MRAGPQVGKISESERLDVLLVDYEQVREEERHYASQQTTLIAITLTAVTIMAAIVFGNPVTSEISILAEWRDPVFFVTPLLAIVPLLFLIHIGTTAVWRSFYSRALEREIRQLIGNGVVSSYRSARGTLPMVSYSELYVSQSVGRGPGSPGLLKVLLSITYPIIVLVVGGLAFAMASQIDLVPLRLLMFLVYGAGGIGLLAHVARVHFQGRLTFENQLRDLAVRLERGLGAGARDPDAGRSPISYYLIPRPDELATKSGFLFLGLLLAFAQLPGLPLPTIPDILGIVLLWIAIELLLYQARYQWNDILGAEEDAKNPTSRLRGRLPAGAGSIPLSWIVILLRLSLIAVILTIPLGAGAWGIRLLSAVLIGAALIIGTAIAYELVRWWIRVTKHSTAFQLAVLCTVLGAGYVARLLTGYAALGGPLSLGLVAGTAAVGALGVYFVVLTWLSEAAWDYQWSATRPQVAERQLKDPSSSKAYLTALLLRSGAKPAAPSRRTPKRPFDERERRVLLVKDLPRIPLLPLGLSTVVWFAVGGVLGTELVGLAPGPWWPLPAVAGGIAALISGIASSGRSQYWKLGVAAALLAGSHIAACALDGSWTTSELVRLAFLVLYSLTPLLLFAAFGSMDYGTSRQFMLRVGRQLRRIAIAVYRFASGQDPRTIP